MEPVLHAITHRRAIKVFDAATVIPLDLREKVLDAARHAPSSFNTQPYRVYWAESPAEKAAVAKLCLGQAPANSASALVVVVADIGSISATQQAQACWMRKNNFSEEHVCNYERTARIGRLVFAPGPFGIFGAIKKTLFRLVNLCRPMGMPPCSREEIFKWATKSTSLACQNLMIAAEVLGMNTCPMEGFDGRRLLRYLGLSGRQHEVVMVIAIGRKSASYVEQPQWRRPLSATVTVL